MFRCFLCSDLRRLYAEIVSLTKSLTPKLVKLIKVCKFPLPLLNSDVSQLVFLRQKYIANLSKQYGMYAAEVRSFFIESITRLEMRLFAIEQVHRSAGSRIPGIDGVILTCKNKLFFLEKLKFNVLNKYQGSLIKLIYIFKGQSVLGPLGISTIYDRLVQTLFLLLLDPIIDNVSDYYSFGSRKNRNVHQALGQLVKFLQRFQLFGSGNETSCTKVSNKFILNFKVLGAILKTWLLRFFPIPDSFKFILRSWLNYNEEVISSSLLVISVVFFQGSIIGPCLVNFCLNGLEVLLLPNCSFFFCKYNFLYVKLQGRLFSEKELQKQVVVFSWNKCLRYLKDFVILSNSLKEIKVLLNKVYFFLKVRGCFSNLNWVLLSLLDKSKFEFLGFVFHLINFPKSKARITRQFSNKGQVVKSRCGLFVYPSRTSIFLFKKKIKELLFILRSVVLPNLVIRMLNYYITRWSIYFVIGNFGSYRELDHFLLKLYCKYLKYKFFQMTKVKRIFFFFIKRYKGIVNVGKGQFRVWDVENFKFGKLNFIRSYKLGSVCQLIPFKEDLLSYYGKSSFNVGFFYNLRMLKLRVVNMERVSLWVRLFIKQEGLCCVCGGVLDYFNIESLKIWNNSSFFFRINKNIEDNRRIYLLHVVCVKFWN